MDVFVRLPVEVTRVLEVMAEAEGIDVGLVVARILSQAVATGSETVATGFPYRLDGED